MDEKLRELDIRKFLHDGFARVLRAIALALERGMLDWANLVAGEGLRRKGSDAT